MATLNELIESANGFANRLPTPPAPQNVIDDVARSNAASLADQIVDYIHENGAEGAGQVLAGVPDQYLDDVVRAMEAEYATAVTPDEIAEWRAANPEMAGLSEDQIQQQLGREQMVSDLGDSGIAGADVEQLVANGVISGTEGRLINQSNTLHGMMAGAQAADTPAELTALVDQVESYVATYGYGTPPRADANLGLIVAGLPDGQADDFFRELATQNPALARDLLQNGNLTPEDRAAIYAANPPIVIEGAPLPEQSTLPAYTADPVGDLSYFSGDYNADGTSRTTPDAIPGATVPPGFNGQDREMAVNETPEGKCSFLQEIFGQAHDNTLETDRGIEITAQTGPDGQPTGVYEIPFSGETVEVPVTRSAGLDGDVDPNAVYNTVAAARGMSQTINDLLFDSPSVNPMDGLDDAERTALDQGFTAAFAGLPAGTQVNFTYVDEHGVTQNYTVTWNGTSLSPSPREMPEELLVQLHQQGQAAAQATGSPEIVQMDVAVPVAGGYYYVDTELVRAQGGSGLQLEYQNSVDVATPVVAGQGQGHGQGAGVGAGH